ncbi:YqcI/YcgG family protein [Lottiidibacillus patelloidae]|nr:YqcI/YcgG family protein [Lottiidibacillus patelloidae]
MKISESYQANQSVLGDLPHWGNQAFKSFTNDLLSEENPFPCILGVEGMKAGQLRFCFIDSTEDESALKNLASHLTHYLQHYKKIGKNTSFVAFFKPDDLKTMEQYEKQFWGILQALHKYDNQPWPKEVPKDPNNPLWEFSFQNEPIFVVCNTPAHEKRKSRYSSTFMMTFQPRWVFEGMNAQTKKGQKVQKIVRDRLKKYDKIKAHPELNWYGDPETREWKQYFLRDENDSTLNKCPFHTSLKEERKMPMTKVTIEKNVGGTMEEVVREILPEATSYVEIQNDAPHQEHPTHTHPTDEILHILEGTIYFTIGEETTLCHPGDRIYLPKETVHGSKAGPTGCLYVISIQK